MSSGERTVPKTHADETPVSRKRYYSKKSSLK